MKFAPQLGREQARQLRQLQTRHGRRKSACFVAEGLRCCREALRLRPDWLAWAVVAEDFADAECLGLLERAGCDCVRLAAGEFAQWVQTESPQGILLALHRPSPPAGPPGDRYIVVLDRVGDPGNMGTILRTVLAVGGTEVAWTSGGVDPFGPKAVRAGMGAQFHLHLRRFADLAETRAFYEPLGYAHSWLAAPRAAVSCFDAAFTLERGLLVLGNEAHGVGECPGAREVRIPMPGPAESLNVAQAAAILLYLDLARQSGLVDRQGGGEA